MRSSRRIALSAIVGFGLLGASGCSERRISTAYYVEIDNVAQPTNRLFRAGDEYTIVLRNGTPGFVYLLRREPSGSYRVLFPATGIGGGSAWLGRDATVDLPIDGQFEFPSGDGEVELILIVSTHHTEDLAILEIQTQIDATVGADIIQEFEKLPGTVQWPAPRPSDIQVRSQAVPPASGADYRGNLIVVHSPLPEVGAVARFGLRHEAR